ncbi:MAG TPA: glucose 1-dehydrogenase [Rhizomicrobium sp.]|nr:glucose 1-dehydrogenase [Rhizomicrobium sp.]
MTGRVEGKVVLITGAAGAFGQVMTARFVADGARVIAGDLADTKLSDLGARHGDAVRTIVHDVRDAQHWAAARELARTAFGRLDVVINNAGISQTRMPQDPEHVDLEQWRAVNTVNVEGVLLGCQAAIQAMKNSGGVIINISSIAALNPSPKMAAYGASKAAVRHLTRTVALYCAQQGYNIRCNSIHPGWFMTDLVRNSRTPAELKAQSEAIPLRRFGDIEDVANAALYLASDEARYLTGAKLVVDGGVTMEP